MPARGSVPGVDTLLPGKVIVQVDKRDEHVVDGVRDDHVVVDTDHGADDDHGVADACGGEGRDTQYVREQYMESL